MNDFNVKNTLNFSRGYSVKATCSKNIENIFAKMTDIEEVLAPLIISMLGKDFSFNGETINGEEYFENYCNDNNIKFDNELVRVAKDFAMEFLNASQSKGFSSFLFSSKKLNNEYTKSHEERVKDALEKYNKKQKSGKLKSGESFKEPKERTCFSLLRNGIFPIKNTFTSQQSFSVCKAIHSSLSSYYQLSSTREEEIEIWRSAIHNSDRFDEYQRIGQFFSDFEKIEDKSFKFSTKTFRTFLRNWQQKGKNEKSLKEFFEEKKEKEPNKKFVDLDKFMYGYDASLLNLLFFEYKDLWELFSEDIKSPFLSTIIENFHFKKEHINFSTRKFNKKNLTMCLGDNQIHYTMSFDGSFHFKVKELDLEIDTTKGIFTYFEMLNADDKKGIYNFRYATDSKSKHKFIGSLKEPRLRLVDDQYYLEFPISGAYLESNKDFDFKELSKQQLFFKSSFTKKKGFIEGKHNFVSFDIGLNPLFTGVCGSFEGKEDEISYSFNKVVRPYKNSLNKSDLYKEANLFIRSVSHLLKVATNHKKKRRVTWNFKHNGIFVDCASTLEINKEEFLKELDELPNLSDEFGFQPLFQKGWSVTPLIKKAKGYITKIRSEYRNADDKKFHTISNNFADFSLVQKIEVCKNYISLQKSLSKNKKDCCKSLKEYTQNLSEKLTKDIAAAFISIAIEQKARFIFLEDLDAKTSSFENQDKNSTKRAMRVAELRKWIANRAEKFGIAVIAVDPDLTSLTDNETRYIGHRDRKNKKNLYVVRNNKIEVIDSDVNAAKNIAIRAFEHHADINHFRVEEVKGGYRLDASKLGVRKQGALKKRFGYSSLFIEKNDGKLKATKLLGGKKKLPKINKKAIYSYVVNDVWHIRHESDAKVHAMAKEAGFIDYDL